MKLKSIDEVIANLPPNDARIDWWQKCIADIRACRYSTVLRKLLLNNYDIDFAEQVEIVAGEIAKQSPLRKE